MKKTLFILLGISIVFSGCGSYTASGAYTGSMLGSILGSAIGGINDGPRGSDIGTIIGMAGGAAVGAAIGSAADKAQADQYQQYHFVHSLIPTIGRVEGLRGCRVHQPNQ